MSRAPQRPTERRRIHGPIRPMPRPRTAIERLSLAAGLAAIASAAAALMALAALAVVAT